MTRAGYVGVKLVVEVSFEVPSVSHDDDESYFEAVKDCIFEGFEAFLEHHRGSDGLKVSLWDEIVYDFKEGR